MCEKKDDQFSRFVILKDSLESFIVITSILFNRSTIYFKPKESWIAEDKEKYGHNLNSQKKRKLQMPESFLKIKEK